MNAKAWLLGAACLAAAVPDGSVCRHRSRGDAAPVSLDRARRAREDLARALSESWRIQGRLAPDLGWDSGLPACRNRERRIVRTAVPRPLAGKTLGFGPEGAIPAADVRVATRVARLASADADALGDPALAARLGVRCWPTRVTARSEVELELVENP